MAPEIISFEKNSPMSEDDKSDDLPTGSSALSVETLASVGRISPDVDQGWAWVALAASFGIQMIIIGAILSMGIFYSALVEEFGGGADASRATSWLLSASFAMNAFTGPVGSILANRFGYTEAISLGGMIAAIGYFIGYFSHSYWLVFFAFSVLPGFGLGLASPPSFGVIAFYFVKRKAFATTCMTLATGMALILFPPLERYLIDTYSWQGAALVLGAISLNLIPLSFLFTHRKNTSSTSFLENADVSLFSKISFYLLMISFFLMAGYNIWNVSGARFAVQVCGVKETDAPWLYIVQGSLNICTRFSVMIIATNRWTKSTRARWIILNVYTIAGGVCLAAFGFSSSFIALCVCSAGIGYFVGGRFALLPALQIELFKPKRFTTSWAYGVCLLGAGTLVLPSIGDWIAAETSTPAAPFYLGGACVAAACAFTIPLGRCLPTSKNLPKNGKLLATMETQMVL